MGIGQAHGGLDHIRIQICGARGTKEGKVVPDGTLLSATVLDLANERIAKLIGPVGAPVSDDVGVPPNARLRVVVDDLGGADLA